MIICRTPLRVSFFGGGTDYPVWYDENRGAVMSTTINKFSYITVRALPEFFEYRHRIRYFKQEFVNSLDEIEHPSVREVAKYLKVEGGLEIVHTADLPARSGLGSSSTFTVGLLHAIHAHQYRMASKRQLSAEAIHVEQKLIGENVGSQDQVAAAFGGFNVIEFGGSRAFEVNPLILQPEKRKKLENNLLLCFTGFARTASEIAGAQIKATNKIGNELGLMMRLLEDAKKILEDETSDLEDFGRLLDEQWQIKRSLTPLITSDEIDVIYSRAKAAGAIGGKLLGAGGGGFMLFYAAPEAHADIKNALPDKLFVPFHFEEQGSQLIYHAHSE